MRVKFIPEDAPRQDLVPILIENISYKDLNTFYKARVDWYDYPLIHRRMSTYGLFEDLKEQFPKDPQSILKFIDYATDIAYQETDKRFLNALFLVLNACELAANVTELDYARFQSVVALFVRVRKLSFVPNITSFWKQIIESLLINNTEAIHEFLKVSFQVKESDFTKSMDMKFPTIDNNSPAACPASKEELQKALTKSKRDFNDFKYLRSALIEKDKYWLYIDLNSKGDSSDYLIVKQDVNGEVFLKTKSMWGKPIYVLVAYHYTS